MLVKKCTCVNSSLALISKVEIQVHIKKQVQEPQLNGIATTDQEMVLWSRSLLSSVSSSLVVVESWDTENTAKKKNHQQQIPLKLLEQPLAEQKEATRKA